MTASGGGRESALARWLPQIAGWLVAALVGLGVYQSRIAVLERTDLEHERRLGALERERHDLVRLLGRVSDSLERIEKGGRQ